MTLSDADIDRFSRQIILPQIGGSGQTRLLASSVAIGGHSGLAEIVALSLTGAGIGRIALHGADRAALRAALVDLHPGVQIALTAAGLGSADADVLVACDLPLGELDRAAASRRPLVAGGVGADGGWLVVTGTADDVCASCAAREAGGFGVRELAPAGWGRRDAVATSPPPTPKRPPVAALQSGPSAGVIGSLMGLAVLKLRLGLGASPGRVWLQFDAGHSTLIEQPIARAADCPVCAAE